MIRIVLRLELSAHNLLCLLWGTKKRDLKMIFMFSQRKIRICYWLNWRNLFNCKTTVVMFDFIFKGKA